ncbi:MAG: hypothetical protein ACRDL8_04965 [Solirubrobacteraceae bacterium]
MLEHEVFGDLSAVTGKLDRMRIDAMRLGHARGDGRPPRRSGARLLDSIYRRRPCRPHGGLC